MSIWHLVDQCTRVFAIHSKIIITGSIFFASVRDEEDFYCPGNDSVHSGVKGCPPDSPYRTTGISLHVAHRPWTVDDVYLSQVIMVYTASSTQGQIVMDW